MQQEPNTVHMRLYTPSGVPLNFVLSIRDGKLTETLPDVAAMEAMIAASGYLVNAPGLAAGEELETITHVILRIQHNKSDGSQTPCIGMYYENPKLVYCKKAYLNTPEDIATFERLSGLKLAQLPKFPGQFPKRDDLSAAEYILAAKTPFQIRMVDGTYTDEATGEVKPTKVYAGFYEAGSSKPAPAQTSNPASGNTGQQGTGSGDNKTIDLTEQMLLDYTIHMYKHAKHQEASFKNLRENGVLTSDMKPFTAACHVLMHRALTDYMMDADIVKEALGGSLKDHLATDGNSLITAWNIITVFANSHKQTAN